jgi:hypothetical protein
MKTSRLAIMALALLLPACAGTPTAQVTSQQEAPPPPPPPPSCAAWGDAYSLYLSGEDGPPVMDAFRQAKLLAFAPSPDRRSASHTVMTTFPRA